MWSSLRRRASSDDTAQRQRTEDYQQNGFKNYPTSAYLPWKQGLLVAYNTRTAVQSLGHSIGHLWRTCRVFAPKAFEQHALQQSPRTSISEILRFYASTCHYRRDYASLRLWSSASLRSWIYTGPALASDVKTQYL